MALPISAVAALALSLAIFANACNSLIELTYELPTHRFTILNISLFIHDRIISRTRVCSGFEIVATLLCNAYWTLKIIMHFNFLKFSNQKLEKFNLILNKLWNHLIRPTTIIICIISVYAIVLAYDDTDLLRSDLWNFFARIFYHLQNTNQTSGKCYNEL